MNNAKTWNMLNACIAQAKQGKKVLIVVGSAGVKHWIKQRIEESDPGNELQIDVRTPDERITAADLPVIEIDHDLGIFETRKGIGQ